MKTQLVVTCIVLGIGCQQCASSSINQLDPLGLLRSSLDPSTVYVSGQSLELPNAVDVSLKTAFPLDQPLVIPAERAITVPGDNLLRQFSSSIKTGSESLFGFVRKLVSLPINIIKFLLAPVTITYSIVKFFVKLFFLPLIIGWQIFKLFLFPVKYLYQKLAALATTPPYVVGVPNNPSLMPYPIYAP